MTYSEIFERYTEDLFPEATFMFCVVADSHQLYDNPYPHVHLSKPLSEIENKDTGMTTMQVALFFLDKDDHSNTIEAREEIWSETQAKLKTLIDAIYQNENLISSPNITYSPERLVRMGTVSGYGATMTITVKKQC